MTDHSAELNLRAKALFRDGGFDAAELTRLMNLSSAELATENDKILRHQFEQEQIVKRLRRTYVAKRQYVQARQVERETLFELADWVRGAAPGGAEAEDAIDLIVDGHRVRARVGDWITRDAHGVFEVVNEAEFRRRYELAEAMLDYGRADG